MIRFFKGFSAQPRLRVVVDTMVDAAAELTHLFFFYMTLLLSVVMMALFLFGHRVSAFSDASSAIFLLFYGGFPLQEFSDTEPEFAVVRYLLYMPILMILLYELVFAIIYTAFYEAQVGNKGARPLWAQTRDVCVDLNAECKN